ncbi:MAG: tRNA (adenosine(37)-N6)-dimethylallyltransferase MiaA [Gammaproteobacteria bacterium]|nr:tRNA (adenosine(37)-N6)-dimethylallyltransferase MiaA [Gammaproteobacteria bacterium]
MPSPAVICIMGATATGKTELAVEILERYPVEIISVDSALVYREMNIGTAKPDAELLSRAPHFLIDIVDPAETYSAWHFVNDTRALIDEISLRGNRPLLVGGTMMYYHALENGLNDLPEADAAVRTKLDREARLIGWDAMHAGLCAVDPQAASRIKPGDSQRIQRALEIFEITGQPMSTLQDKKKYPYRGEMLKLILNAEDRSALHTRIENRFQDMLTAGFIDEVIRLRGRGDLNLSMPSMRCVGYRQVWQYLDGEFKKAEMQDKAVAATRQLAKRQLTWLRKQPQKNVFDCLNRQKDAIFKLLDEALQR